MILLTLILFVGAILSGVAVFVPEFRMGGLLPDMFFLACVSGFLVCLTLLIRRMIRASMAAHMARFEDEQVRAARQASERDRTDASPSGANARSADSGSDHPLGRHGSIALGTRFEPRHAAAYQSRDIRHLG